MQNTDVSIPPVADIHCHILPAFDDGAKTIDESTAMAEISAAGGVDVIVATPHIGINLDVRRSHEIRESVDALQDAIDRRSIDIKILAGAEVFPSAEVPEWIDAGYPITLANTNYILLDCPLAGMPVGMDQLVFRLQSRGITPILAHPERAAPIQLKPQRLEKLVQNGMLIQLDALSVLGRHGSAAAAASRTLLRHGWVHFLASDAHSSNQSRPRLAQAAQVLIGLIGEKAGRELVLDNPYRLLNGESIPIDAADYSPSHCFTFLTSLFRRR